VNLDNQNFLLPLLGQVGEAIKSQTHSIGIYNFFLAHFVRVTDMLSDFIKLATNCLALSFDPPRRMAIRAFWIYEHGTIINCLHTLQHRQQLQQQQT